MKQNKNHSSKRAEGKTQISISLDESLVSAVDKQAKKNYRNRSNYISFLLSQAIQVRAK